MIDFSSGSCSLRTVSNISAPNIGTISLWIYPTTLNYFTTYRIFGTQDNFEIRITNNTIYPDIGQGGGFSMGTISVNTLYHILIRYNFSTGALEGWIDGSMVGSGTGYTQTPTNAQLSIGTRTGSTNYYAGYIDDFRIYNRWISDNEIQHIYQSRGCDFIYNSLVNRWLFLEQAEGINVPSGTGTIKDYIGNNNCSLYNGTVVYRETNLRIRMKKTRK